MTAQTGHGQEGHAVATITCRFCLNVSTQASSDVPAPPCKTGFAGKRATSKRLRSCSSVNWTRRSARNLRPSSEIDGSVSVPVCDADKLPMHRLASFHTGVWAQALRLTLPTELRLNRFA